MVYKHSIRSFFTRVNKMENSKLFRILLIVAAVFIAGFAVFHIISVNEPEPSTQTTEAFKYTRGPVVEGPINVPSGDFISYRLNLNRRGFFSGTMRSPSEDEKMDTFLFDDENFKLWKEGKDFQSIIRSDHLSYVVIKRDLEPGIYHLVFSGRSNPDSAVQAEASFSVE